MKMIELVEQCRSYRRFDESTKITNEELKKLVGLARLTASTANSQALKYKLVTDKETCDAIFPTIGWAGALADWDGPAQGERPVAYIVICCDGLLGKNKYTDVGITAQTMMLGATEMGYGGCMLGNIKRTEVMKILNLDSDRYTVELILALGKPIEQVEIVSVKEDGDIRYYRDENQVHYVPKRSLENFLL